MAEIIFAPWELIVPDAKARALLERGVLGCRPRGRAPPGRTADAQSCSLGDDDAPASRIAGRSFYIVYEDAAGEETERTITLRHLTPRPGGTYIIHAFCHERMAPRAFKSDQVLECFDGVTGVQIELMPLLAEMTRRHWHVDRADLEDFVRVLVFMAYCDGRLAAEEVGAIDDAISRYVLRMDGTDDDFDQAARFARYAAIEGIDFLSALRRLIGGPNPAAVARLTLQALTDVMEADFELVQAEIGWHQVALKTIRGAAML